MPKWKPTLLNVRENIEHMLWTIDNMLERDGKYPDGLVLAPIDQDNLRQTRLCLKGIIRKADANRAKGNRKDLYVEAPPH